MYYHNYMQICIHIYLKLFFKNQHYANWLSKKSTSITVMRSEVQTFRDFFKEIRTKSSSYSWLLTCTTKSPWYKNQRTFKTFQMFLRFSAQNTFGNPQYVFKNVLSTIFCNRFYEHINSDTKEEEKSRVRNLERCRASKNIFENNILYQLSTCITNYMCNKHLVVVKQFFFPPKQLNLERQKLN